MQIAKKNLKIEMIIDQHSRYCSFKSLFYYAPLWSIMDSVCVCVCVRACLCVQVARSPTTQPVVLAQRLESLSSIPGVLCPLKAPKSDLIRCALRRGKRRGNQEQIGDTFHVWVIGSISQSDGERVLP